MHAKATFGGFIYWVILIVSLAFLAGISGCGQTQQEGPILSDESDTPYSQFNDDSLSLDRVAICVWPLVGLRKEPGRKTYTKEKELNYITTILYGEKVEMLTEEEPVEVEGRTYMKVRLKDGEEGWVHDFVFEPHGSLGVIIKETEVFRRPDLMTLRDIKYQPGEIIVVIQQNPGIKSDGKWYHVSTREKSPKGWVYQGSHISMQIRDVRAALLLNRAIQVRDHDIQKERLNTILEIEGISDSPIQEIVQNRLKELESEDIPETQKQNLGGKIFITGNEATIHSDPIDEDANVIKQLQEDDVCIVLDIGERQSINDMNDYWYRIRHEDTEGWVYGYYTSIRFLE